MCFDCGNDMHLKDFWRLYPILVLIQLQYNMELQNDIFLDDFHFSLIQKLEKVVHYLDFLSIVCLLIFASMDDIRCFFPVETVLTWTATSHKQFDKFD